MTARRLALLALLPVTLAASGCGGGSGADSETARPAVIEHVKGSNADRVRLTAEAARRIGVRTALVHGVGSGAGVVIPYAALLYDPDGNTWTYTSPKPLVFERRDITVARIDGNTVVLSRGPKAGTRVVTEGATEIWGVEYGGIQED
jgi:multidrug efflux pump subunit AcrA (membrane-fusion protein)